MKEKRNLTTKEMVVEVDIFIKQLGLNKEILGLKNIQDDLLYYHNYINSENIFRGIIEIPNYYFVKLANLLCNTTERLNVFYEKFYSPDGNIAQQFRKYRRYLLDTRENTDEFLGVMDKMIKYQLFDQLYGVLKELYLEPFEKHIFDRIVDLIHSQHLTANDIYEWFRRGKNIKAIVTFIR
jgi:hypothetical protein